MLQIEERAKNYTIEVKYYKYKNIVKNREHRDNNYMYNTLNKFAKSNLNYKNFEKEKKN